MLKNKTVKTNWGQKSESTIVNLTNLLPEIWDWDNITERKVEQKMNLRA
jgi:hypothetical protein